MVKSILSKHKQTQRVAEEAPIENEVRENPPVFNDVRPSSIPVRKRGLMARIFITLRYLLKRSPGSLLLILLLIGAIGTSVYFYKKANRDPQADAAKELQATIKLVSRHMVLPADEQPTLATVSDPAKLKDQAFFTRAEKGDKVLLYSKSGKAILYSMKQDKILEVSPFNVNNAPATN
jgi:hypothetical protein